MDTSGWLEYFADSPQARHCAGPIDAVALYAGKVSIEKRLPMADAFIYATALLHHATVYTQDAHFEGLAQLRYFAKATAGEPK